MIVMKQKKKKLLIKVIIMKFDKLDYKIILFFNPRVIIFKYNHCILYILKQKIGYLPID